MQKLSITFCSDRLPILAKIDQNLCKTIFKNLPKSNQNVMDKYSIHEWKNFVHGQFLIFGKSSRIEKSHP